MTTKTNSNKTRGHDFRVEVPGHAITTVTLSNRTHWTANALQQAGAHGLTQLDMNGGVLREYVYRLRKRGVPVDAAVEKHGGEFAGLHRRYTLGCTLVPVLKQEAA